MRFHPVLLMVLAAGGAYAARSVYHAIVNSYRDWSIAYPKAARGLESAIGAVIVGVFLFGIGSLAWLALSDTEARGWKILSNVSVVVGLVSVAVGGYGWYSRLHDPPPTQGLTKPSVIYPGAWVHGVLNPDSACVEWKVVEINEYVVEFRSVDGKEQQRIARSLFDSALAANQLVVGD